MVTQDADSEKKSIRGSATQFLFVDLAEKKSLLDISDGGITQFGLGKQSAADEQLLKWMKAGLDSNLPWALVGAFGLHERFLKDIYAVVGFLDPSHWRGLDFGETSFSEVAEKDRGWYSAQVRRTANSDGKEILKQLRNRFPQIEKYEKTN